MSDGLSEVEENTFRVLLSTFRKHDPDALRRIIFDVLLAGLGDTDVQVLLKTDDCDSVDASDDPAVESAVIAIRGAENASRFFAALEASGIDEAEDTELP